MTKLQLGLKTKKGPSVVCTDKSNAFKLRTERDGEKEKERKREREGDNCLYLHINHFESIG